MIKIIGLIFLLILAAVVVSFTTLNAQSIQVNYYFGTMDLPLAIAIVLSIAVGILFGFFASAGIVLKLKRENLKLKKSVKNADRELGSLRTVPPQ